MNQELIGYACVALFTIGCMLLFCIDILKKSYKLVQFNTLEENNATAEAEAKVITEVQVAATSIIHEKNVAYPFYVGYIHSTDELSNLEEASTNRKIG